METETKLNSVEHQLLSLILSAGLLNYFEIKSVREIKIGYEVLLQEKAYIPVEYINNAIDFYPEQAIHLYDSSRIFNP